MFVNYNFFSVNQQAKMTFSKTLKLSNGVEMPIFGLGTWQVSWEFYKLIQ